jgi:hypothetical protein
LGIDETGGKSVEVFNRICDLVVTDHILGHRHRHRGSFRLAKRQRARNHVAVSRQPLAGHRANHPRKCFRGFVAAPPTMRSRGIGDLTIRKLPGNLINLLELESRGVEGSFLRL